MERGRLEGAGWAWRRKGGLETPLVGRFIGENKRLTFAPPVWYDALVLLCIAGGPLLAIFAPKFGWPIVGNPVASLIAGGGALLAGLWGALSNERMACDLRHRSFARLEGQGLAKRISRGWLDDLDALVLLAEEYPLAIYGRSVVYRLVLYWKGHRQPLLVVEREMRQLPASGGLNAGAAAIAQRGARYAQALGIPFYDNSYFHSAAPVPVL